MVMSVLSNRRKEVLKVDYGTYRRKVCFIFFIDFHLLFRIMSISGTSIQ